MSENIEVNQGESVAGQDTVYCPAGEDEAIGLAAEGVQVVAEVPYNVPEVLEGVSDGRECLLGSIQVITSPDQLPELELELDIRLATVFSVREAYTVFVSAVLLRSLRESGNLVP